MIQNQNYKKRKSTSGHKHHKKKRFMWGEELHQIFIAAMFDIGLAHATLDLIAEAGAVATATPRVLSESNMDSLLRLMREFRADGREDKPTLKIPLRHLVSFHKNPRGTSPKGSATSSIAVDRPLRTIKPSKYNSDAGLSSSVLSVEALQHIENSQSKYSYREFPHLKVAPIITVEVASETDPSPFDVTRPFSPLASEIDSFDFNWTKEDFDSSIIKLFLPA
jgi:hypothetical protein